jgi:hypothetical protein
MFMLKKTILIVILVCLVFLTTFLSKGYCNDWVYVESKEDFTSYYKSSSIKIDVTNKIIKIWVKHVYTDKGKIDFINHHNGINKHNYNDIDHSLFLVLMDYKGWKRCVTEAIDYSKSSNVLSDGKYPPKWVDIPHGSVDDLLLNKLLQDHNIQK